MNRAAAPLGQASATAHRLHEGLHTRRGMLGALAALPVTLSRPAGVDDSTTIEVSE